MALIIILVYYGLQLILVKCNSVFIGMSIPIVALELTYMDVRTVKVGKLVSY